MDEDPISHSFRADDMVLFDKQTDKQKRESDGRREGKNIEKGAKRLLMEWVSTIILLLTERKDEKKQSVHFQNSVKMNPE